MIYSGRESLLLLLRRFRDHVAVAWQQGKRDAKELAVAMALLPRDEAFSGSALAAKNTGNFWAEHGKHEQANFLCVPLVV